MRIRTDDEVYRVDAVWLGPPKATFPWRARYVAWAVGIVVFLVTLSVERQTGFSFSFFTVAWALVITIALTRFITHRITHERPLGAVFTMWVRELTAPRERASGLGGAASATRIRVQAARPRPGERGRAQRRSVGSTGVRSTGVRSTGVRSTGVRSTGGSDPRGRYAAGRRQGHRPPAGLPAAAPNARPAAPMNTPAARFKPPVAPMTQQSTTPGGPTARKRRRHGRGTRR